MSNSFQGAQPSALARDVRSGLLVFLIALPLCLGIALASGFPPVAGVLTAIIGGCVCSWLGGARLTIKGPAAGLIVIAIGAVTELGQGDLQLGYHRALAVGVIAALVQLVFASFRVATLGIAMSRSVVHGMLAAIGVIIMAKQAHVLMGVKPEGREIFELIAELPHSLVHANPEILLVGVLSLLILLLWPRLRFDWAKVVPAPLVVLAVAIPLSALFHLGAAHIYYFGGHEYQVGPHYLVQLPGSLLGSIALPDFSVVFSQASLKYIVMFALVGTIESTLSVLAVDAIDPEKRQADLNRDLRAVAIGNLLAASIGGLPMISEIVRSKANVDAGATSLRANFVHGVCLLMFVAFAPGLLGLIPLAALGAMLVYTGSRLASPNELVHVRHIGLDQAALFLTTMVVTLLTDLLIGVGCGLMLKIVLHALRGATPGKLFRSRIEVLTEGDAVRLRVHGVAAFPCVLALRRALQSIPAETVRVVIDLSSVPLVDHTFLVGVHAATIDRPQTRIDVVGHETLRSASAHPHAARWGRPLGENA
ncbi:MAG: MFS superfamily sulfate permease-like transporter [Gammaproteobacteria bacterium]|jgi:MFS superfamily sulfate permease-like transporter